MIQKTSDNSRPYDYTTMDDVISDITTLFQNTSGGDSTQNLSQILANGNETNGNNIKLSDDDVIKAENGTCELNLRAGGFDNIASLTSQDGDLQSGFILDPVGNVYGTGLFTIDIDNGDISDISEIRLNTIASYFNLLNGDLQSCLELDPTESSGGTRLYTEDTSSEQLTQIYISPTTISTQAFDSNLSIYNGGLDVSFTPGMLGNNDKVSWSLQATNVSNAGFSQITGEVDLVTDESKITMFADIILMNLPTYDDNADAISGGLITDAVYKTSTGELRIVI